MTHGNILISVVKSLGLIDQTDRAESLIVRAATLALGKEDFTVEAYKPVPQRPVLQNLANTSALQPYFFRPNKLSLSNQFFPDTTKPDARSLDAFFNDFKNELKTAAGDADRTWLLLEQYGSSLACHPDATDISLFDFIKITTAYAVCLQKNGEKEAFCLLAASVSGIQNYLYDIISKNAAKLLKGRSFYIQLITDSLVEKLLTDLDLPPCNVVYASGGGFYVLAPDNNETKEKFDTFVKEASQNLYKKHKAGLFVDAAISESFGVLANLDVVWDDLMDKIGRAKWRRLSKNAALLGEFNKYTEFGGTKEKDPITNVEFGDTDETEVLKDGVTKVLKITHDQIELGKHLRDTKAILTTKDAKAVGAKFSMTDPFDYKHYLLGEGSKIAGVKALNAPDGNTTFLLYGGDRFPYFDKKEKWDGDWYHAGEPKPYDLLSQGDNFDRLGVLRMDVDGLGTILSSKMETSEYRLNLSRYSAISRSLDWFFKGYLNTIQSKPAYREHTIIIYSGGDDLFIVGRWKEVLDFAKEIRTELNRWVCNNPAITISGGIAIVPGKFPIMQAAKMAAQAEDDAKDHKVAKDALPKNAFSLLDMPLHWDKEFSLVEDLKTDVLRLLQQGKITNSFLTKVSAHAYARQLQSKKKLPQRWRWVMAYDFSRFIERVKEPEAKQFLKQVMQDAFANRHKEQNFTSRYHYLDLLNLACRWAELEHRTIKK